MKKLACLFLVFALFMIEGCSEKKELSNNIIKSGEVFEIDNASFYYPVSYELSIQDTNLVEFEQDDAKLTFKREKITEANQEKELIELYRLDLENRGFSVISNTQILLENGDQCREMVYSNDVTKGKALISFDEEYMILFIFEAPIDQYEDSISSMNNYLYSLTITEKEERMANESN